MAGHSGSVTQATVLSDHSYRCGECDWRRGVRAVPAFGVVA